MRILRWLGIALGVVLFALVAVPVGIGVFARFSDGRKRSAAETNSCRGSQPRSSRRRPRAHRLRRASGAAGAWPLAQVVVLEGASPHH